MVRVRLGCVLVLVLLTGCSPASTWTPTPIRVITPTPVSVPASATPSSSGSATSLSLPDADGAIDADAFPTADFASPSGRIWCSVGADHALCHFPSGMSMKAVPASATVCPGEDLDVTGVSIGTTAGYFCSGGVEALPQTTGENVGWWKGTGLPKVTYDHQSLAVLPYGRKLARGDYVCLSEKSGVTCANTATRKGFRVALAGVTLIG
ncbi:MAG: hypothetical protein QM779_12495 [Propionicimonas sp.]|uniref:hypothetical protein n=1 Tax=Propionicimonas sp. TaxID=1955623 RepID=UPI003D1321F9